MAWADTTSSRGIALSLAAALGSSCSWSGSRRNAWAETARGARVLTLAFFPTALFLQAVYSESLFLFLCLGAFLLAERGRFAEAGLVVGLALLTRPTAVALVPPLMLIAGRRSWRLITALPVAAAYPLLLWWKLDDPWAFARAEGTWHRHLSPAGPARRDLGRAARRLGRRRATRVRLERARLLDGRRGRGLGAPAHRDVLNLQLLGFLGLLRRAHGGCVARVGAPYGLFAALSLALPLQRSELRAGRCSPCRASALVIFPFFLALAWIGGRATRARTPRSSAPARLLLGVFVAQMGSVGLGRVETDGESRAVNRSPRLRGCLLVLRSRAGRTGPADSEADSRPRTPPTSGTSASVRSSSSPSSSS